MALQGARPPRMRIIVCQASYGDTLGIEIDPTPPQTLDNAERLKSQTRKFILIDGGPAVIDATGKIEPDMIPVHNLYKMLNELVPVGSTGLDTLVVTHDDADHMFGIADLLRRLNAKEISKLWEQGTTAVTQGRAPFNYIWHNSAETMVNNFLLVGKRKEYMKKVAANLAKRKKEHEDDRAMDRGGKDGAKKGKKDGKDGKKDKKDDGKKPNPKGKKNDEDDRDKQKDEDADKIEVKDLNESQGYFDEALKGMAHLRNSRNEAPKFNSEFQRTDTKFEDKDLLKVGFDTTRGHVTFNFIGPGDKELKGLSKFFTENTSTLGSVGKLIEDKINTAFNPGEPGSKFSHLAQDLVEAATNDGSKKNLSSIVFEAIVPGPTANSVAWSGLFTGDASACQLFDPKRKGPGKKWDGTPINYDLIKIGHHGSCHNNFFTKTMINNAKKKYPQGQTSQNPNALLPWYPVDEDLNVVFSGENVKPTNVDVICLSNVLAYFCNVRAKNYIISASHDRHPNPHLSTVLGIIARAVLFPLPNGQVVNIYLTNPLSGQAWNQILTYWFKTAKCQRVGLADPGTEEKGTWSYNSERDYADLEAILKHADTINEKLDGYADRAVFGLIAQGQSAQRYFQFHYLRADKSWGAIRTDPVNALNGPEMEKIKEEWDAWVAITPHETWTEAYVFTHYSKHFAILGDTPGVPTVPHIEKVTMKADGSLVLTQVQIPKTPPNSPNYDPYFHHSSLCFDMFSVQPTLAEKFMSGQWPQQNSSQLNTFMSFPQDNLQMNTNGGPNLQNNFTFLQMAVAPTSFKTTSMKLEEIPAPRTKPGSSKSAWGSERTLEQIRVKAPPVTEEKAVGSRSQLPQRKATQETRPQTRSPNATKPNYEAFRKFGVDEFEVPTGDDFEGTTEMKIKHLDSFAQLLAYLVENNKLKVQDAVNAGTKFAVDGYPMLGALAYLLLGAEATDTILKTLPLEFPKSVKLLDDVVRNPVHWPVQLLDVSVVDLDPLGKYLENASGIQQLTMRILPPLGQKELVWVVPNDAKLLGKGTFQITINECIDVTIYWPTDSKRRIVHGRFFGSLPTGKDKKHNIACNWLVMPSQTRPVVYHIEFCDENYTAAAHEMNILEVLSAFDGVAIDLGLAAADLILPGLIDPAKPLGNHLKLTEPGFTLCRDFNHAKDLRLHGVFGRFSVDGVPAWTPFRSCAGKPGLEGFLAKIQIPTPSVRLSVQDLFRAQAPRVFFRLNHAVRIGNADLTYELETRPAKTGQHLLEFTFRPVAADTPQQQPLSLKDLLDTFGLAPLTESDLPAFVSNTLTAVSVTAFRLGWAGKLDARLPDYLEVGVRVRKLSVAPAAAAAVPSLLDVDDVTLRLRIDNPARSETRNVYLQSGGVVHIAGVEHVARLKYGVNPAFAAATGNRSKFAKVGPVELAIRTTRSPLTLGAVLGHFWPGVDIVPEPFEKVADEVGMTEFVFKTGWSEASKGQVVKVVKMGLGVRRNQIEILEGMALVEPKLEITAYFPFDSALRTFVVRFSSMVFIDEYSVLVNVGVAAGQATAFAVSLRAGGEGFPVGAFLKFASRKISDAAHKAGFDIPYPENFGVFDRTELDKFSLLISKGEDGKYGIRDFSISAASDLQLDLWGAASLERVSLDAGYKTEKGFNFTFGAELQINEHTLFTTMGYDVLPNGGSNTEDVDEKGWFITAEYADEIDLLAIAKKLVDSLDVAKGVSDLNMDKMKTDKDRGIVISNLAITLQKAKSGGGIYISADTDWAIFEHVDFAATYYGSSSWGFCLSMELKDNLLSLIPAECAKSFSEWIEVNDTRVAIYVGKVDPGRAGLTDEKLPPRPGSRSAGPSSTMQAGLAVSTTLKMTDKFGVVKKWIAEGELQLEGHISTQSVGMRAKIPRPIRLLEDKQTGKHDIEIEGWFNVNADKKGVEVGLSADMKIRCPPVTKDLIALDAGFVINTAGGVGFDGSLKGPLRDLFGIEGLEARGLSVKGVFSLAESGVPEELGMTGALSLAGTGARGQIAFYFAQRDIMNCYFSGTLENLDMAAMLNFFLKREGLPQIAEEFLGGNVVINKLRLEAALSNIYVHQLDEHIERGFLYEAGLYIKAGSFEWSGYTCIEVRLSGFQFIAMMSQLSFSSESETFFRLRRGSYIPADHSIPTPKGKYDANMLRDGPIIYISTKNKTTPLLLSAQLKLVGLDVEVNAKGHSSGWELAVPYASLDLDLSGVGQFLPHVRASASGFARVKPNERATAQLGVHLDVDLELPSVPLSGLGQLFNLPGVGAPSVGFDLTFDIDMGWPGSGTGFHLGLAATVRALNQKWNIGSIAVNLSPRDLDTVAKLAEAAIAAFLDEFPSLIKNTLGDKALDEITGFVKTTFSVVTGRELTTAVAILADTPPEDVIRELGLEALLLSSQDGSRKELMCLLGDFYGPQAAMRMTTEMFPRPVIPVSIPSIPVAIPVPIPSIPVAVPVAIPVAVPVATPVWVPDIFRPPKISIGPFRLFGIQAQPDIPLPKSAIKIFRVDDDGNEVEEKLKDGGGATPESEPTADDGVFSPLAPRIEAPAEEEDLNVAPVPATAVGTEVEVVGEGGEPAWTQEQINQYVREERIALIGESMEAFGVQEVFAAARELFPDLSDREVAEYMVAARAAGKGVEVGDLAVEVGTGSGGA